MKNIVSILILSLLILSSCGKENTNNPEQSTQNTKINVSNETSTDETKNEDTTEGKDASEDKDMNKNNDIVKSENLSETTENDTEEIKDKINNNTGIDNKNDMDISGEELQISDFAEDIEKLYQEGKSFSCHIIGDDEGLKSKGYLFVDGKKTRVSASIKNGENEFDINIISLEDYNYSWSNLEKNGYKSKRSKDEFESLNLDNKGITSFKCTKGAKESVFELPNEIEFKEQITSFE